jgi:hypothetical protein
MRYHPPGIAKKFSTLSLPCVTQHTQLLSLKFTKVFPIVLIFRDVGDFGVEIVG